MIRLFIHQRRKQKPVQLSNRQEYLFLNAFNTEWVDNEVMQFLLFVDIQKDTF
jgi:hypothetical protein